MRAPISVTVFAIFLAVAFQILKLLFMVFTVVVLVLGAYFFIRSIFQK
jgi:hypothetical protein